MSGGLIGSSPIRRKNLDLLTGSAPYVGDIRLDGLLYAQVVRSSAARGRIVGIDCGEALRAPGVVTVITADDIDDIRIPIRLPFAEAPEANLALQPPLADGVVRYAGEPVAVVVATDPYAASDSADGGVRVDRFALAHDVGRAVNPRLLTGQLAGAAAQGIGGALLEEIAYDSNGQPLTTSFADYTLPTAAELPNVEVIILEYGCSDNPLGIKGGGEAGIVGALGAVANAVADALGPEAEIVNSSVSPARVWRALNPGRRSP